MDELPFDVEEELAFEVVAVPGAVAAAGCRDSRACSVILSELELMVKTRTSI